MKLNEVVIKLGKSKIKAGDGKKIGKYPLYTCSPTVNKFCDEYLYDTKAVILSTGGNPVVNYYNGKFSYSTDCLVLQSRGEFEEKYIYYYLIYKLDNISKMFRGVGIKHLNKKEFFELDISLIDKEKQNQIINNLDIVNNLIKLKKEQLREFDNIIKSQFVEMFGDPILNEMKWNTDTINNVAPIQNYKGIFENKVWLLNLDMVESNSGRIINYIYEDINNIGNSTSTFNEENILYSKLRPYLNKVVIPNKKGYATSELVPLKPSKDKLNRFFLAYLLRTEEFVKYISGKVSGAKMPRVSMDIFKKFNLILPPLELQNKFADIVKKIDKQKFVLEKNIKYMKRILDKNIID